MTDLMKLTEDQLAGWWHEDDHKRLIDIFHAGDAIRVTGRGYGINLANFARIYRESGNGDDMHKAPLDAECEIFPVPNDPMSVIMVNPNINVLRDLISNSGRWESITIVNSDDYREKQPGQRGMAI